MEDAQLARKMGGEFLDDQFLNVKSKHRWLINGKEELMTMDALQTRLRRMEVKGHA